MADDRDKADVFKYYDESEHISSKLSEPSVYLSMFFSSNCEECKIQYEKMRHWYKPKKFGFSNDSRTMIKLHAFFSLFSGGFYTPQIIFFAFISLLALIFMMKGLQLFQARSHLESLMILTLLPSILFWTSAPIKECLFALIIGSSFYHYISYLKGNKRSIVYLFLIVLSTYFLKPQVGILLVGSMLFFGLLPRMISGLRRKQFYIGAITLITIICAVSLPVIFKKLNQKKQQYDLEARGQAHIETENAIFLVSLDRINGAHLKESITVNSEGQIYWLKLDKENWYKIKTDSLVNGEVIWINKAAESHVDLGNYDDFFSWLKLTPTALKNIFIEPLPKSSLSLLFFIENIFLIVLIFLGFKSSNEWSRVLFLILFSLSLSLLYGTTVPIIGAILRYKSLIYLSLVLSIFASNKMAIIPYLRRYD